MSCTLCREMTKLRKRLKKTVEGLESEYYARYGAEHCYRERGAQELPPLTTEEKGNGKNNTKLRLDCEETNAHACEPRTPVHEYETGGGEANGQKRVLPGWNREPNGRKCERGNPKWLDAPQNPGANQFA